MVKPYRLPVKPLHLPDRGFEPEPEEKPRCEHTEDGLRCVRDQKHRGPHVYQLTLEGIEA